MSDPTPPAEPSTPKPSSPAVPRLDHQVHDHTEGLKVDATSEEGLDRKLAEIEMIGEEAALGFRPTPHPPLSPEVRYLHISRTINQLITDRNRSVGIFLGIASLLFAASTALLNARPDVVPIIPLAKIQYWCLPVTFGTLSVIGLFMCLILVRTRIGLIYEVSKMNALLGLPSERVKRVNPFSIFFLMYLMVALLGGACAGLTAGMLLSDHGPPPMSVPSGKGPIPGTPEAVTSVDILVGCLAFVYVAGFLGLYYGLVLHATTETKLETTRR